jgi:diguanylate cyclase (GGDEF)-like protein
VLNNPLKRHASIFLIGGTFLVLVGFIAALAINGVFQLRRIHQQTENMVLDHERKVDIVTQTQVAAHTHADRLTRMALERDPFIQDDLWMQFLRAGYLVGYGRNELKNLGFTPREQVNFDEQGELIRQIDPTQEKVIDLIKAERYAEASKLLVSKSLPLSDAFNRKLAELREMYQQDKTNALGKANQSYRLNLMFTVGYGLFAAVLGASIGILALRRMAQTQTHLQQHMTELEASYAALEDEATHDPLTDLANRRLFYDHLHQAIRHAKRYRSRVGVLFVDMNHFKEINDHHGHHVGDAVLTEVAARILKSVRESDTVARLGGDEFAVLLENVHGREDCLAAAQKIEEALRMDNSFYGLDLELSASIGQSIYPDDGFDEDTLLRAADASMYKVKQGAASRRQGVLFASH